MKLRTLVMVVVVVVLGVGVVRWMSPAEEETSRPEALASEASCTEAELVGLDWQARDVAEDLLARLGDPEVRQILSDFHAGKTEVGIDKKCPFDTFVGAEWAMVAALDAYERGARADGAMHVRGIFAALDRALDHGVLLDLWMLANVAPWAADLVQDHGGRLQVPHALLLSRHALTEQVLKNELRGMAVHYADSKVISLPAVTQELSSQLLRKLDGAVDVSEVHSVCRQAFGSCQSFEQTVMLLRITGAMLTDEEA